MSAPTRRGSPRAPLRKGPAPVLDLERQRLLIEAVEDYAIVMLDVDGAIASWNTGAERIKGYRSSAIIGCHFSIFHTEADRTRGYPEALLRDADEHGHAADEGWRVRADGSVFWASVVITAVRDADGTLLGYGKVTRDLTERHAAQERVRASEERFYAAFAHAPVGMALIANEGRHAGRIAQANMALAHILGREPDELIGLRLDAFLHPDDRSAPRPPPGAHRSPVTSERRYLHRDGRTIWVIESTTAIPNSGGAPAESVTHILDISERKRFEGQLRYLADHDPLTGLYNRHRFESELERVVNETRRYHRETALMVLDLDGFKYVNDRFGHSAGDELVKRIASLLRNGVRDSDIVARLGGDEFAIILHEASESQATAVADKLLSTIRNRAMVSQREAPARVTTSIGITVFDGGCDLLADELVVEADIAMYDAKEAGRDRFDVYDRATNRRAVVSRRQSWLDLLRTAIDSERFVLYAQPIQGICSNGIARFELLLRMRDEGGDLIPPSAFLYNAERFDLMGAVDRWVLSEAVMLLHRHALAGNAISLSVNLSGKTMNDLDLVADLSAMLAAHPVPEGRLVIEVTETAAIVNIERARELAEGLRELGCRFALDDFGAGFASFYYLKHLEFDYLKIDGEFIQRLTDTPTDQLVVGAVVEIARGLNTKTVAEFVGDDETVALLRELGVDYGQGYHLGRPGPLHDSLPALASGPDAPLHGTRRRRPR